LQRMDFLKDCSGRYILRLGQMNEVPEFAKEAAVSQDCADSLPDSAFADPVNREFPIDTPGHVWLGYGYCKLAGVKNADIISKLETAGRLHGIQDDIRRLDSHISEFYKQASAPKRYAVEIDFGDPNPDSENRFIKQGGKHGFYPCNSAFELEQSAVKLVHDQPLIPIEAFAEACDTLVKTAREFNMDLRELPRRVVSYGTERIMDTDTVNHFMELRKQATGDEFYTDLAKLAQTNPEGQSGRSYATLCVNADRLNGYKQAKSEPDPFQIFGSGPTVEAVDRSIESWVSIADAPIPVEKVASVKESAVRKWFAKETADRIVELIKRAATSKGSKLTADFMELDLKVQQHFLRHVILD
jgi:hypothetical protein